MSAPVEIPLGELPDRVGADLGTSEALTVDQPDVDAFGRVTRDEQWIHSDPERAAQGPFKATIAHGFFTLSLCSHFLEQLLRVPDAAATVNYGLDRVRFPSPLFVGSRVRARGVLADATAGAGFTQVRVELTIEAEGAPKPSCVANLLVRLLA